MSDTAVGERQEIPVNERTRLRRAHRRAVTDRQQVYAILDAALECHVGYVFDGQPYVTPTAFVRLGDEVFWHGSSASRMLCGLSAGIPVCFTVSLLDGLVIARSGFHSSFNYRSVMAFGTARQVESRAEKLRVLEAFTDRVLPGRWAEVRPVNEQELKATRVMALKLEELSCKVRAAGVEDEPEDYALPIWAGVVPVMRVTGRPEPDAGLDPTLPLPAGIDAVRIA